MAKTRRAAKGKTRRSRDAGTASEGSGGFMAQIGLFETGNGLPHGVFALVLALVAAIVVYPISRLVRSVGRHLP
jgi:hypothetical protein